MSHMKDDEDGETRIFFPCAVPLKPNIIRGDAMTEESIALATSWVRL